MALFALLSSQNDFTVCASLYWKCRTKFPSAGSTIVTVGELAGYKTSEAFVYDACSVSMGMKESYHYSSSLQIGSKIPIILGLQAQSPTFEDVSSL